MNAIKLADYMENTSAYEEYGDVKDCVEMLRKQNTLLQRQDAAIKQLREALKDLGFAVDVDYKITDAMYTAKAALAATEEFNAH